MVNPDTVDKGRVQRFNHDPYRGVRHPEVPAIDITLRETPHNPGGRVELATSLMAPALANALSAATGERVRSAPFQAEAVARS